MHRRLALQAGLLASLAWVTPAARACEYHARFLRITHPWTRATAPDATYAVLCMTIDEVSLSDRLIGVQTPVASGADMGGLLAGPVVDFALPAGQESVLAEGASFVRLTGLKHPLEVGRSYPLQLLFEKSGSVNVQLNVDYTRFRFT